LQQVLADIAGGSESLGELDVLAGLRRRKLPEPSRQSIRRLSSGQAFLDVEWDDWKLVLEIDGSQHDAADHRVADVLRDIDVTAAGSSVLRIPLYVWRIAEEEVLDRLAALFAARTQPTATSA
jgi:very-short-patch-repair endonuclease